MNTSSTDTRFQAMVHLRALMEQLESDTEFLNLVALENPWFTPENVRFCLRNWIQSLADDQLSNWIPEPASAVKRVGVVCAGNIPLVGLHDVLSIVATGHQAVVKLSHSDKRTMRRAIQALNESLDKPQQIEETEKLEHVDAVIATGSNNSSRYFEYYFKNIPHVIRKNRTGVAVLTGEESPEQLHFLAKDIFTYFGLGCRNVTKLFLPQGYDFEPIVTAFEPYYEVIHHHKYANNYTYHKAIFLMNLDKHLDSGFLLFKEDQGIHAPLSCVFFEYYDTLDLVQKKINDLEDEIQVVVGHVPWASLPFGVAQETRLMDYADNLNTIEFLQSI
ncbi:MAG: acyl-CoA reductase [Flavobacteriales bacterium]|nr:acyl-CoA reductase [Flavobacteriales bacterium]